jgi:hypothetical protein
MLFSPGLEKKITLNECKFYLDQVEVGGLQLTYVSSRCTEWGSLFGAYVECWVSGGKIDAGSDRIFEIKENAEEFFKK